MPIELKMPALSPTMEEGTLAKWLVDGAIDASPAEQGRVRTQPLLVQPSERDDRLVEGLAGGVELARRIAARLAATTRKDANAAVSR